MTGEEERLRRVMTENRQRGEKGLQGMKWGCRLFVLVSVCVAWLRVGLSVSM